MASSLRIEEQSGARRSLELRGGGLPHHWAAFPVEQRVVTKWSPGNSADATQQVLGPREGSPEWEGEWNTTLLVGTPCLYSERGGLQEKVARARTLANIVEAIVRSGALLTVTWTEDDSGQVPLVRLGRIAKFEPAYRSNDDVRWRISWEWKGRGPAAKRVANFAIDKKLTVGAKVQAELARVTAELEAKRTASAIPGVPFSATGDTLGQFESFLSGIKGVAETFARKLRQLSDRIDRLGQLAQGVETLPAEVAAAYVDAFEDVRQSCAAFADDVTRRGPEAYAAFDQGGSVGSVVRGWGTFASARQSAMAAAAAAVEERGVVLAKSGQRPGSAGGAGKPQPGAVSVVVARAGESFAGLSLRALGRADLGPALARANGYAPFAVGPEAGALLVVPSLQAAQALLQAQ